MGVLSAETVSGVIECVAESLALESQGITAQSTIMKDLRADSLDFLDIMFRLEQRFKIKLQKEDFNLFARLKLPEGEAIQEGLLTSKAKEGLVQWLPSLPVSAELRVRDLGSYISVESIALLVESRVVRENLVGGIATEPAAVSMNATV